MVTRRSFWRLALIVICVTLAGVLLACEPQDSGPRAWIDQPLDGISVPAGEPVKITFHAYARAGVAEVLLSVNGEPLKHGVLDEPEAPFTRGTDEWLPTEGGDYRLEARTFDVNGESSLQSVVSTHSLGYFQPVLLQPNNYDGGRARGSRDARGEQAGRTITQDQHALSGDRLHK